MKLDVLKNPNLPALGWFALIGNCDQSVQVQAGSQVEVTENSIVEGAWSGQFRDFDFCSALTFTGTGLVIEDNVVKVSTPTHTLAPIYLIQLESAIVVSNSIPILLAASDDYLNPAYPFYDSDIMSVIFGLDSYIGSVPTDSGRRIILNYLSNIYIDKDLSVRVEQKSIRGDFSRFDEYYRLIKEETSAVIANATDALRSFQYKPITTVSSGYDSPACAVLAKNCGVVEAITLKEARSDFLDTDDSGRAIAEALDLKVTEMGKHEYFRRGQESSEVEILSTGFGGDDIVWVGAEDHLKGSILFTGYHGDKIWDTKESSVSTTVKRGDPSGSSLLEFRLRAGFLNFPIPFITCQSHPQVYKISRSEEMTEWRLGNNYDRPIPRRIVEEQGVSRRLFGQSKKAVALPYNFTGGSNASLEEVLSEKSLLEFRKHLEDKSISGSSTASKINQLMDRIARSYKVNKLAPRFGLEKKLKFYKWRHRKPVSEHNFITAWAANKLRDSYRVI